MAIKNETSHLTHKLTARGDPKIKMPGASASFQKYIKIPEVTV